MAKVPAQHCDLFGVPRPGVCKIGEHRIAGRKTILFGKIEQPAATPCRPARCNLGKRRYLVGIANKNVSEVLAHSEYRDRTDNRILMAQNGGITLRAAECRA